ncbi:flagellar basal body-associated FliL family protein [Aminobacter aminovorans]|uniref:flagellar basal body-associated FliL family protein n=1 Tax=Aminobacter aminovorans TaxID=83263 RepID=UPI002862E2EC|nr:flagellar basal body-associated FliL family protein [Aminobacter aminovorans]MDR7221969.1 flagellar FliL protein [Aminobacter aminovorans]
MSDIDQFLPQKPGPSLVVQLGILAVLTVGAIGMGWLSGGYLKAESTPVEQAEAEAPKAHAPAKDAAAEHGPASEAAGTLVQLPAITANLTAPDTMWIRLEVSLVLDAPQSADLAERVHQDLLAYVRTLRIHQVQGASAFRHLKTDLDERAAIRSDGHVKEVLIRTLLFE